MKNTRNILWATIILLSGIGNNLCGTEETESDPFDAVKAGDILKVQSFLDKGGNIKIKDEQGRTLLHEAAYQGHEDIAELLLRHRAHIEAKDKEGFTPIFDATEQGHRNIVALFLAHDAKVNATNNNGLPLLASAISAGYYNIVKLLLDRGADPNQRNNAIRKSTTQLKRIWYWLSAKKSYHWGKTPLFQAATSGHRDLAELLLNYGAKLDAIDNEEDTPLHYAAAYGHLETTALFIDHGAEVNAKNKSGFTPLDTASFSEYGKVATVNYLLAHGAKIGQPDRTLLSLPVREDLLPIVETLLVTDPPSQRPKVSLDRIFITLSLCAIPKKRCSEEQPLAPLPRLPLPIQDLILSYLEEDTYPPHILARMFNNLHANHYERIRALMRHCPRSLCIEALKTLSNNTMKQTIAEELIECAIQKADSLCNAECKVQKKHLERYTVPVNPQLLDLIHSDDPKGIRAAFICRQIKKEFTGIYTR